MAQRCIRMCMYVCTYACVCVCVCVACSWRSMDARMPVAGVDSAARENAWVDGEMIWSLATAVGEWLSEERRLTLTSRQTTATVRVNWSASSTSPQSEPSEPPREPRPPLREDSSRKGSLLSADCRRRPDGSSPAASRNTVRCAWPSPRPMRPTTPPSCPTRWRRWWRLSVNAPCPCPCTSLLLSPLTSRQLSPSSRPSSTRPRAGPSLALLESPRVLPRLFRASLLSGGSAAPTSLGCSRTSPRGGRRTSLGCNDDAGSAGGGLVGALGRRSATAPAEVASEVEASMHMRRWKGSMFRWTGSRNSSLVSKRRGIVAFLARRTATPQPLTGR